MNKSICFLGPDGVGKSTVILELVNSLKNLNIESRIIHLKPKVFGKMKNRQEEIVSDPHSQNPRGYLSNILKIVCWYLEYSLGYFLIVKPALRKGEVIIFDRYFHDILVDPKRYRFERPMSFAKRVAQIVPHPDIVFVLNAPAAVVQSRKEEVPFVETQRQLVEYKNVMELFSSGFVIDATKNPSEIASEIIKIIEKENASHSTLV
jgi:thymidylate kinase